MIYLLLEAIIVSIVFYGIFKIIDILFKKKSIEFKIIVCGLLGHIIFELSGLNNYYCKNGVACKQLQNKI